MTRTSLLALGLVLQLACVASLGVPSGTEIRCDQDAQCPPLFICDQVRLQCVDPKAPAAPGVRVSLVGDGRTSETGGLASVSLQLLARPEAAVTMLLDVTDATEGRISEHTVTILPEHWSEPRNVAIVGQPDCLRDGDQAYTLLISPVASEDPRYQGIDPDDVVLTNTDDNAGSIAIMAPDVLETSESGVSAVFFVQLGCAPSAEVILPLATDPPGEAVVSPAQLVLSESTWQQAQAITVTGISDCRVDGDKLYTLVLGPAQSTDSGYAGIDPADITLLNRDTSDVALVVSSASGTTDESGTAAPFGVRLPCKPSGTVTLTASTTNPGEGRIRHTGGVCAAAGVDVADSCTVTFDATDWSLFHHVDVIGIDDDIDDGTVTHALYLSGSDPGGAFDGVMQTLPLYNTDNDTAGITQVGTVVTTGEDGSGGSFHVALQSQPTADVTIELGANAQGSYPASVTLTAASWRTGVDVTVTGTNNTSIGLNPNYAITMSVRADCPDPNYAGRVLTPVAVSVADNDKYVFATAAHNGNFGGVASADTLCTPPSGYPTGRVYKALLASVTRAYNVPGSWVFGHDSTLWRIGDGLGGGSGATLLSTTNASGWLSIPLSAGFYTGAADCLWTGVDGTGLPSSQGAGYRCQEWTSIAGTDYGTQGTAGATDIQSVTGGAGFCASTCRVLCVEQ